MKTAMQELIDELDFFKNILWKADSKNESILVKDIIRKAVLKLEKEKNQIKRAFEFGIADAYNFIEDDAEQYYNETYNK
jgi:hypothetical protein